MTTRAKILLVAITLFFIAVVDINIFVHEFGCNTEKTVEYTFEECEKESKEKNQSDEFTNNFSICSIFSSDIVIDYLYKQKKNTFKLSITIFKPPIIS